jgi:hypothetical protein
MRYLRPGRGVFSFAPRPGAYCAMPDKTYLVQCKAPEGSGQIVLAATIEVHGEHLAFLNSAGRLAALFLLENVKSWNVINDGAKLGTE